MCSTKGVNEHLVKLAKFLSTSTIVSPFGLWRCVVAFREAGTAGCPGVEPQGCLMVSDNQLCTSATLAGQKGVVLLGSHDLQTYLLSH